MAKYSNTVEYKIVTNLDSKGLQQFQAQLNELKTSLKVLGSSSGFDMKTQIKPAIDAVRELQRILNSSFNSKLGMLDLSKLNKQLTQSKGLVQQLNSAFTMAGSQGTVAANNLVTRLYKMDSGLKSISSTADKVFNTIGNTVRWGIIASGFSQIMNAAHQAVEYTKELDKSLTNIMMVSGETRDNMNEFARSANEVAKRLGGTTVQMTEATKVFIQQGYNLQQSSQLGEYAVHLANVSEQDSATSSDEITAYMNAFKIPLEDLGNAISKWAAVANNTAADVEELSIASQKAASVAATVGVDLDQFAAHIATIESVTREAPENIGNGLKTIYSRIADISLGETLEDGVNLGSFAKALEKVGVDVLDQTGKLRDAGIILEDLMGVWQELDQTQRAAVAKTVAGRFQLARFEALMNRADIYEQALETSRSETGTATYDRMQETYRESMEGRMNALQASVEEIFLNLFTSDSFYGAVDALQLLVDTLNNFIEAVGGGSTALNGFILLLGQQFSTNIARGIANIRQNRDLRTMQGQQVEAIVSRSQQVLAEGGNIGGEASQAIDVAAAKVGQYAGSLNAEQMEKFAAQVETAANASNKAAQTQEEFGVRSQATLQVIGQFSDQLKEMGLSIPTTNEEMRTFLVTMEELGTESVVSNESIALVKEDIQKMVGPVQAAQGSIAKFKQNLQELGPQSNQTKDSLQGVLSGLYRMQNVGATKLGLNKQSKEWQTFRQAILTVKTELGKTVPDMEKVNQVLTEAQPVIQQTKQAMMGLGESVYKTGRDFTAGEQSVTAASSEMEIALKALGLTAEATSFQVFTETMMKTAMGIGQLAFAWQSFQSLGSIIADEDMDIGEKFLQIIMNLGFTLPMLVTGLKDVAAGYKVVTAAIEENQAANIADLAIMKLKEVVTDLLTKANKKLAGSSTAAAAGETAQGAAAGGAIAPTVSLTAAVRGLGSSLIGLIAAHPVIFGIVAALSILTAIIGAVQQAEQDRKERLNEAIDASNEYVETIKQNKENLDKLIDSYRATGEASDEFKDALLNQAEALGIVDAQQLIALGRYDDLIDKINETSAAQLEYNNILLQQRIRENNGFSLPVIGGAGVLDYSLITATENFIKDRTKELQNIQKEIANYQIQLEAARAEGDYAMAREAEIEIDKLSRKAEQLDKDITDLSAKISTEEAQQEKADVEQLVENDKLIQLTQGSALDQEDVNSLEELSALMESGALGQGIKTKYETLGGEARDAFLTGFAREGIDAGVIDESLESDLEIGSALSTAIAEAVSSYDYSTMDNKSKDIWREILQVDDLPATADEAYDILKENLDTQFSNLTDDQKIQILEALDFGNPAEVTDNINKIITGINDKKNLSQILVEIKPVLASDITKWFENSTYTSADAQSILGVDEDYYEYMMRAYEQDVINSDKGKDKLSHSFGSSPPVQHYSRMGDYTIGGPYTVNYGNAFGFKEEKEGIDTLTKSVNGLTDSVENYEEILEKAEKLQRSSTTTDRIAGFVKESAATQRLEASQKQLTETTEQLELEQKEYNAVLEASAAQYFIVQKGVDSLAENFEEWNEALSTGGKEGNEAFRAMAEALSYITSIDKDAFTPSFITDNLNTIEQAANGSREAIIRLQRAAAEEYEIKVVLPEEVTEIPQAVENLLEEAQQAALNNEIEIGGTFNPEGFQAGFDALVAAGVNAHDALESILNSMAAMGLVADPSYKDIAIMSSTIVDVVGGLLGPTAKAKANEALRTRILSRLTFHKVDTPTASNIGSKQSSGGGSGGGGRGGGGSSKANEPKSVSAKKAQEAEFDIYNKVDDQLDKLGQQYDSITGKKSRMYGPEFKKYAKDEITNLEAQNKKLEKRNEITAAYIDSMISGKNNPAYGIDVSKGNLAMYGLKAGDDGTIKNYAEVYAKLAANAQAAQKAADDFYKKHGGSFYEDGSVKTEATMSDEDAEKYNKLTEAASRAADKVAGLESTVNNYQNATDKMNNDTEEIVNNLQKITDIKISIFEDAYESIKNIKEFMQDRSWLKGFDTGLNTDNPFRELVTDFWDASAIKSSIRRGTDALSYLNSKEGMALYGVEKNKNGKLIPTGPESNLNKYIEDLKTAYKDLLNGIQEYEQTAEQTLQDIISAQDLMDEQIQERIDKYELIGDQLDHNQKMLESLYGDKAFNTITRWNKNGKEYASSAAEELTRQQISTVSYEIQEAVKSAELWKKQVAEYDKLGMDKNSEVYKDAVKKMNEWDKQVRDLTEKQVEHFEQLYTQGLDRIAQQMNKMTFGDGNLEWVEQQWEMAKDGLEGYLDDVESAYEKNKIQDKFADMLNNTNDAATRDKILKQQKQILDDLNKQRKVVKGIADETNKVVDANGNVLEGYKYEVALSQFDVDLANAKITALQKQMALEEAQRNKNRMELRRDTQGNYNYVYTANEEDVAKAESELEDADYDIYEMSKNQYSDILDQRFALYKEYQDKKRWANETYKNDTVALDEKLNEIDAWYTAQQVNLGLELEDSQRGMIEGAKHLAEETSIIIDDVWQQAADTILENWEKVANETGLIYNEALIKLTSDLGKFQTRVKTFTDESYKLAKTYHDNIIQLAQDSNDPIAEAAGNNESAYEAVTDAIDETAKALRNLNIENDAFWDKLAEESNLTQAKVNQYKALQDEIENLRNTESLTRIELDNALKEIDRLEKEKAAAASKNTSSSGTNNKNGSNNKGKDSNSNSGGSNAKTTGNGDGKIDKGDKVYYDGKSLGYWNSNKDKPNWTIGNKAGWYEALNIANNMVALSSNNGHNWWAWVETSHLSGYKTGGYTGAWTDSGLDADNGKLALLHQKELVLNASDTENMLAAVGIVRNIVAALQSMNLSNSMSTFGSTFGNQNGIEQRVEIRAEFPNVDTADDIREALLSLADSAYQYAYVGEQGKRL